MFKNARRAPVLTFRKKRTLILKMPLGII
jgi:hypothetical protein